MNIVINTAARKVDQIDDSEVLNMAANLEGKILLLLINCIGKTANLQIFKALKDALTTPLSCR